MGVEAGVTLAGRYRLHSVVGGGGMGTVWRAHDDLLDRDVAVKEVRLPARLTESERRATCRQVMTEARATAALSHPGVVTVHDVVLADDRPWIVMELLRARSLHEMIVRDGPLEPDRVAGMGLAVLAVLRAAHAAGIVHHDVKPSNVLFAADGRIVLTDFGLAVRMGRDQDLADTMATGIRGSPAYLSPEQVRGGQGGAASDLWALGATLYTAVQGSSPYLRSHALASMVAVLLGEYVPAVRATPALEAVIDGLLRQDPAERMGAEEAASLLAGALACEDGAQERAGARLAAVAALWHGVRRRRLSRASGVRGLRSRIAGFAFGCTAPGGRWAPAHRVSGLIVRTFRPHL